MPTYDIDNITEDEAIALYHSLSNRFGWRGTFFTREDAENSWTEYHEQTEPFTDETWNKVTSTWYWNKGLGDIMTERGWDVVHEAVSEAIDQQEGN